MPVNNVRKIREALMMSKAELARKAGLSTLTIDRVEAGKECRLDTKRKILHALGMKVSEREEVFQMSDGKQDVSDANHDAGLDASSYGGIPTSDS